MDAGIPAAMLGVDLSLALAGNTNGIVSKKTIVIKKFVDPKGSQ